MPILLPVRPGTVTEDERTRLSAEGVIVIEHTAPGELVLPGAQPDLPAVLAAFISRLATSLPEYRVSVTGTVTVEPVFTRAGGGGPPLNADGSELPPPRMMQDNPRLAGYSNSAGAKADLWVFVAVLSTSAVTTVVSAGVISYSLSSTNVASTTAPAAWLSNRANYTLTAYRLAPGNSVSWQNLPQSGVVIWSRLALSNE